VQAQAAAGPLHQLLQTCLVQQQQLIVMPWWMLMLHLPYVIKTRRCCSHVKLALQQQQQQQQQRLRLQLWLHCTTQVLLQQQERHWQPRHMSLSVPLLHHSCRQS
jgi:hypothetical protein